MKVTGRARWLLKVDETPKRWPEKSCSERTSIVNSEIGSVPWQVDYVRKREETIKFKH